MRVLVIEDDQETAAHLLRGLREHGHVADLSSDGRDGLFMAGSGYDVPIVDRMLPRLDGLAVVHTLRAAGMNETRISRLRGRLGRGGLDPELIHTVRGAGYVLRAP